MVEQTWRRSSYSGATDGSNCVEVAWHKSSYSGTGNGDCVEVALIGHAALVRDSKAPAQGQLEASPVAWHALLAALRA
jgi:hypothetical protein